MSYSRNITDAGFQAICDHPLLKELNISRCEGITDHGLRDVKNLTNLESLDMNLCSNITDVGFQAVCDLPLLKKLNISGCEEITDHGLHGVKNLTNLETLRMRYCRNITDVGIREVNFSNPNVAISEYQLF